MIDPPTKFRRRQDKHQVGNHPQRDLMLRNIPSGAAARRAESEKI
jgi:hypothetical protein